MDAEIQIALYTESINPACGKDFLPLYSIYWLVYNSVVVAREISGGTHGVQRYSNILQYQKECIQ